MILPLAPRYFCLSEETKPSMYFTMWFGLIPRSRQPGKTSNKNDSIELSSRPHPFNELADSKSSGALRLRHA